MDQINIFLRKILESGDDGGVTAVRKAIDLYSSCINTAQIDARGAQPMIDILNATGIIVFIHNILYHHANQTFITYI